MSDNDRVSVQDQYERDEQGVTKGQKREEKQRQEQSSSSGGNGGDGKGKLGLLGLVILGVVIFSIFKGNSFDFRTWNSTAFEGFATMQNSMEKVDHKRKSGEYNDTLYDRDRIYNDSLVTEMVEKEYAVYVYSFNEANNKPFNSWLLENEDEVKIYRLNINDIDRNKEIRKYREDHTPMVLIYNEIDKGVKELDGVIKDPDLLEEVVPRMNELKEEKSNERRSK